jgi:lipoprotein NlpD
LPEILMIFHRPSCLYVGLAFSLLMQACAPTVKRSAPIEDRSMTSRSTSSVGGSAGVATPTNEPGTYVVQRGDTLAKIGFDHGVSWRDIARWNQIENPNVIEVGQALRITGPAETTPNRPITSRPLPAQATSPKSVAAPTPSSPPSPAAATHSVSPAAGSAAPAVLPPDDAPAFAWPASGSVLGGFDESRNKGLDIQGKAGDAVYAAADGRVVYAGSGLRGYGNLVILKHNNTYLTAYAHNQSLLVKEDQDVQRGQKIAEMGNTDADQVKLHFEIRRQGKPVDPARLLPAR